jgi:hypothetical protein
MDSIEFLGRLRSDYRQYPIDRETIRGLLSDGERTKVMIADVGKFLAAFLALRHSYRIETHTCESLRLRVHRVKHGAELHELMTEEAVFCGSERVNCSYSGYVMEEVDRSRDDAYARTIQNCNFTNEYVDFLTQLEALCNSRPFPNAVVNLKDVVMDDESDFPKCELVVEGYFDSIHLEYLAPQHLTSRISTSGTVELGNFVRGISSILEDKVEAWLTSLQLAVEYSHADCNRKHDSTTSTPPQQLVPFIKASLCRLISTHVSMESCYNRNTKTLERQLTATNFETIATKALEMCQKPFEALHHKHEHEIALVGHFFEPTTSANMLLLSARQHTSALISGMRTVAWLSKKCGGGEGANGGRASNANDGRHFIDPHMEAIIGILKTINGHKSTHSVCDVVLAVQLKDWQVTCGEEALAPIVPWACLQGHGGF